MNQHISSQRDFLMACEVGRVRELLNTAVDEIEADGGDTPRNRALSFLGALFRLAQSCGTMF